MATRIRGKLKQMLKSLKIEGSSRYKSRALANWATTAPQKPRKPKTSWNCWKSNWQKKKIMYFHFTKLWSLWMMKWYMKYIIYWTADVKSNKLWSMQLWMQFLQLHIVVPNFSGFHMQLQKITFITARTEIDWLFCLFTVYGNYS